MKCPMHPEEWLYENMVETKGFCGRCRKWYNLTDKKEEVFLTLSCDVSCDKIEKIIKKVKRLDVKNIELQFMDGHKIANEELQKYLKAIE